MTAAEDGRHVGTAPDPVASRRFDPLVGVCFLVAVATYLLQGFQATLSRDSSVYVYGGQQLAEGVLPYVGLVNRAGPLAHAIPGVGVIGARVVGADDLLSVRVLFMLLSAATVAAIYLLGRDLFRSRGAGLVAAAALLAFEGFSHYATFGPREKTAMVLFVTLALIALTRQHWFGAGVAVSLATLTWQPVFFGVFVAALVAIGLGVPRPSWWRALLRLVVGGAVPALVTLAVYAAAGQTRVLLDCFLLINARYTRQSSPLDHPRAAWEQVVNGYGWSAWLFVVGLAGAVLLAALAVMRPETRYRAEQAAVVAVGVYVVGGVAWTLRAFDNWPDTMLLMPAAAVGAGGLAVLALSAVPTPASRAIMALIAVAGVAAAVHFAVGHQRTGLEKQRASTRAALSVLPSATVLSVEAPQPLVLGRLRNPTRLQLYGNGLVDYVNETVAGGIDAYVDGLRLKRPTLIATNAENRYDFMRRLLRGYQPVGRTLGWTWWVDENVPADTRRELRAALDEAVSRM